MRYQIVPNFLGETRASLEPARYRLLQAARRLNELREAADSLLRKAEAAPLRVGFDRAKYDATRELSEPVLFWSAEPFDPTENLNARILAGEVTFHARTALEYLAYQLVWLDRGRPYENSQFPIVRTSDPKVWKEACRRIPGLREPHLEKVRALQPMNGCQWTGELAELNNLDKHRGVLRLRIRDEAALPPEGSKLHLTASTVRPDLYEAATAPRELEFTLLDGRSALPTLRDLLRHVVEVVNDFAPAFKEGIMAFEERP